MEVGIFIPCFIDQIFPETGMNMVQVLKHFRVKSLYNPSQTCCGQVAFNNGYHDECKHVAQKFILDFASYKYVVGPSASCVAMIKNYYPKLFDNSALHNENRQLGRKIFEFTDFLVNHLGIERINGKFPAKVTFHDSCAAIHEYGLKDESRKLLSGIEDLEFVEMNHRDICCGFGGTFSVKFPDISAAMAEQKAEAALETGAQYIVSTDSSCLMHLEGFIKKKKLPLKTLHIVDLIAYSLGYGLPTKK